jgi:ABC-type lipoprotein release transport system permease subunit
MDYSPSQLKRKPTLALLPAITRLARWRLDSMWQILLVNWLGMLAMIVLICIVPLFSQVVATAGVHTALENAPANDKRLAFSVSVNQPNSSEIHLVGQQLDQIIHSNLSSYSNGASHFSVQTPGLTILSPAISTTGQGTTRLITLTGYAMDLVAQQVKIVQGRLPQTSNSTVEIALVQDTANALNVKVGSIIKVQFPQTVGNLTWNLHVVGIFSPASNWEDANNMQAKNVFDVTNYQALTSSQTLLPKIAPLQVNINKGAQSSRGQRDSVPFSTGFQVKESQIFTPFFTLIWSYPFNTAQVNANNFSTLTQTAQALYQQIPATLGSMTGVASASPPGGLLFDVLLKYAQSINTIEAVIITLLVLILGLALFLVNMMSVTLVEQQAAGIATLRSRGATRRHIFGSFVAQGIGLAIIALLVGPFLALLLAWLIAQFLLPSGDHASLAILTGHALQMVLNVGWFALIAALGVVIALILALRQATKQDVLTYRRESSRTTSATRPGFFRRLHLDVITIVLLLLAYALTIFFSLVPIPLLQIKGGLSLDPDIVRLLALVSPLWILAAAFTFFLRFYPAILRFATRIAARGRRAPALLALAQMTRSSGSGSSYRRIMLLLALGVAATFYALTFIATQQQRNNDTAAYQVGADFSGASSTPGQTLAQQTTTYQHHAGVISATSGYNVQILSQDRLQYDLVGVDANTYANTASWTQQYSSQALSSLMETLVEHRVNANSQNVVYAFVDSETWQNLDLWVGAPFVIPTLDGTANIHFIAAGEINYIPGVYDSDSTYGILCDYQSYATVYAKDDVGSTLQPNYVWLKTNADAASLSSVRHAFPTLADRRALIASAQNDPLHINIVGVLGLGVATALLLALIGTLFTSWLSASSRLTSFAVMRALGMSPRQIATVLLWEQGSTCTIAIVLGIIVGYILSRVIVPVQGLIDNAVSIANSINNPLDEPPVQMVIPLLELALVVGTIVVICSIALLLMARVVSRPSLSQTLRLNED